jgi:hypothetical protein
VFVYVSLSKDWAATMASKLGTELPRRSVAWFWFAIAALPAVYFTWSAFNGTYSWAPSAIFGGIAVLIFAEPRLRKSEQETIQVDEIGVLRVDGTIHEQIQWNDIAEIRIITTSEGPFREDVFLALVGTNGKGCLVPHGASVRIKLLEELQSRFPGFRNDVVIKAMGCTSNKDFLVWQRSGVGST